MELELNKNNKPVIKVLLLVTDDQDDSDKIYKHKDFQGNTQYYGFLWDIWSKIEKKLNNKYEFIYTEASKYDNNYDNFVKKTANETYDIVIGTFFYTPERSKLISYSQPFVLDASTILHEFNDSYFTSFKRVITSLRMIIIYLIIFGIVAGILLWLLDNNRASFVQIVKYSANKKRAKFFRALTTGMAAMFGETGYLAENTTLQWLPVILVVLIMTISLILNLFIQGQFTKLLVNYIKQSPYNSNYIPDKPCLGFKGYASVKSLKRFGIKVKYIENMTPLEMIKFYLKNKDKYGGCILSYLEGMAVKNRLSNDELVLSTNFGYENGCFIINSNKQDFLHDINNQILYLRENLILQKLCNSSFKNVDKFVCSLT
jgi:ABC-type amino acid transport substrate-binding protein